nr:hypothetical protein [Tanacetum cinerariifolium]
MTFWSFNIYLVLLIYEVTRPGPNIPLRPNLRVLHKGPRSVGNNNNGGNVSNDSHLHDMHSSGSRIDDDSDEDSHGQRRGDGGGGGFESRPPVSSFDDMACIYNGIESNESSLITRMSVRK